MTEPEIPVSDVQDGEYENLETAYDVGSQEAQEALLDDIQDMIDEGLDDEEIVEALYDPAPRRRHRRQHTRRMTYDPAPKRRRKSGRRKSRSRSAYPKKYHKSYRGGKVGSALGKIEGYVAPAVGIYQFYTLYNARAVALGTNPTTGKPYTVIEALMYDLQNLPTTASGIPGRITANPMPLIATAVGYLGKRMNLANKISKDRSVSTLINIGLSAVEGWGMAGVGKQVLDPPVNVPQLTAQNQAAMQQQAALIAPQTSFKGWG